MADREQELLQVILELRELARLQVMLGEQGAEVAVDWEKLHAKLSAALKKFGVVEPARAYQERKRDA